jgi:hypothetical protein
MSTMSTMSNIVAHTLRMRYAHAPHACLRTVACMRSVCVAYALQYYTLCMLEDRSMHEERMRSVCATILYSMHA